ncbi:MAG: BON domain-containing protein [Wenzhouxiangellaceae bacterium]|nr:BON domain-containing protein [Wenzhouxiangellaceae bacterium]
MSTQIERVRAALEDEAGIDEPIGQLDISEDDGVVTIAGSVASLADKRRAIHAARDAAGGQNVQDALEVASEDRPGDDQLASAVDRALRSDPAFQGATIRRDQGGGDASWITISTEDGVVTLAGRVGSPSHRRLAEVHAWWQGAARVDNALEVDPPREDSAAELKEALTLVVERDRALDGAEIDLAVHGSTVTLAGRAASRQQAARAERNCWAVEGVREVRNELIVAP